jgi:quinol monooxygenase YgiN
VVELVLKITVRAKGIPAMIQALAAVMFQARLERGCVDCQLYAETGNPQSLRYVEAWATPQDLESQLRSQRFGMLLAIMETAPEAPSLEVRTVSEQRGLDYIRAVRLGAGGQGWPTGNARPE